MTLVIATTIGATVPLLVEKVVGASLKARADNLVSHSRSCDDQRQSIAASIAQRLLPRLQGQALPIPRARRARREDRGT